MVSRSALLPTLILASASLFLGSGCNSESDGTASGRPIATKTATTSASTTGGSTTGSGGNGGGGGTGGASSGGGGAGTGGQATGGSGGGTGGGAGGDTGPQSADPACVPNLGFYGGGMAFTFPTPPKLAAVLNALTYDPPTRPFSLALLSTKQPGKAALGISATVDGPNGATFLPGKDVPFTLVSLQQGGFTTIDPSPKGWLRLVDETSDPVDLEIENIAIDVSTQSECSRLVGSLDALILPAQAGISLTHDGQAQTLADLAAAAKPDQPIQIHALFTGESMNFDFGSL